jgi:hypothetical protein
MQTVTKHKLTSEFLWLIVTGLLIVIVLFPIYEHKIRFPFYAQNALLIFLFVTFSRLIFFLPISHLARRKWIYLAIILAAPLFFFVVSTALGDFRNFMDEQGLQSLVDHLHVSRQTWIIRYIKHEMIFFGVGSIITGILLPFRLIISFWRMRNKGTV